MYGTVRGTRLSAGGGSAGGGSAAGQQGLGTACPISELTSAVLLSDGASRIVDRFRLADRPEVMADLALSAPAESSIVCGRRRRATAGAARGNATGVPGAPHPKRMAFGLQPARHPLILRSQCARARPCAAHCPVAGSSIGPGAEAPRHGGDHHHRRDEVQPEEGGGGGGVCPGEEGRDQRDRGQRHCRPHESPGGASAPT